MPQKTDYCAAGCKCERTVRTSLGLVRSYVQVDLILTPAVLTVQDQVLEQTHVVIQNDGGQQIEASRLTLQRVSFWRYFEDVDESRL